MLKIEATAHVERHITRFICLHSDGLHLTPEGNGVVFAELVKILDAAGFSDLPFDFPQHSEIDAENPASSFQQCEIGGENHGSSFQQCAAAI